MVEVLEITTWIKGNELMSFANAKCYTVQKTKHNAYKIVAPKIVATFKHNAYNDIRSGYDLNVCICLITLMPDIYYVF